MRQPMFLLGAIRIQGELTHNNAATLRANVAPRLEGNFLTVDLQAARAVFETVPWVRRAVVRREFPNRLKVVLYEHKAVALWGTEADGFAARVENERAWKVSIEQIKAANWNLDQKNPHVGEQTSHDPDVLLADYARLQAEAHALRDELKGILAQSLAKTAASA